MIKRINVSSEDIYQYVREEYLKDMFRTRFLFSFDSYYLNKFIEQYKKARISSLKFRQKYNILKNNIIKVDLPNFFIEIEE